MRIFNRVPVSAAQFGDLSFMSMAKFMARDPVSNEETGKVERYNYYVVSAGLGMLLEVRLPGSEVSDGADPPAFNMDDKLRLVNPTAYPTAKGVGREAEGLWTIEVDDILPVSAKSSPPPSDPPSGPPSSGGNKPPTENNHPPGGNKPPGENK